MKRSRRQMLREDRKRLENPYAHAEELEMMERRDSLRGQYRQVKFRDTQLHQDRRMRENPYAHLNGDGGFSAIARTSREGDVRGAPSGNIELRSGHVPYYQMRSRKRPGQYSEEEIAKIVRNLQLHIWRNRPSLWEVDPPTDPIKALDLEMALRVAGYDYEMLDGLGTHDSGGGRMEVAGVIDPSNRRVLVSRQFPPDQRRFTVAHELGHAVLHNPQGAIHRDRPFDGVKRSPNPVEREADRFATFFLMPEKVVKKYFKDIFGASPFMLTEETAFALLGKDLVDVQELCPTTRHLSLRLATTEWYNGRQFISLCDRFGVSKYAMAIRLEELALII